MKMTIMNQINNMPIAVYEGPQLHIPRVGETLSESIGFCKVQSIIWSLPNRVTLNVTKTHSH